MFFSFEPSVLTIIKNNMDRKMLLSDVIIIPTGVQELNATVSCLTGPYSEPPPVSHVF